MPVVIRKVHNKASLSQWRETRPGSIFACGLLCYSSLEWNHHEALLVPRSPSRKGGFATMDIIETASKHCRHPLCIIDLRNGITGRSAASNEDSDGPDPIT